MSRSGHPLQLLLARASCSRRLFLLSAMAGALAAAGCGEQQANGENPAASGPPAWLPEAVGDTAAAARLGRIYLEAHPPEQDLDRLLSRIDAAIAPELVSGSTSVDEMLGAVQRAVREDYIHDRVVSVQRWVLSRTEAQVYAALALAAQP